MRRYIRYEPFDIYCFEASEWQHPVHKHTYFEIIFIRSGNGKHVLNGNVLPYTGGDVFLLGPEDYHSFEIKAPSRFVYIRFTEDFIKDTSSEGHQHWGEVIRSLFTSAYQANGSIIREETEKVMLDHLLTVLLHEYENRQERSYETIMESLMKTILSILARNIIRETAPRGKETKTPHLLEAMLVHIRQYISEPGQLRMETLAEKFHYSPNYLSTYFKRQVGEPLQQYILKYKLKLVENRLQNSNLTVSEISHEFGFTDESHLNKVFRKYYGQAPGTFRKEHKA